MGLLGDIFGRQRSLPIENLAALRAAGASLAENGYEFAKNAGICLKKEGLTRLDLTGLLAGAGLIARYDLATDEYGCTWIVLRGDLESTVDSVITACRLLNDARQGGHILCIAFEFRKEDRKAYWIYNRKGLYYPFVPRDGEHDVLREINMQNVASGVLPVEGSLAQWYPLWSMPF